MKKEIVHLGLLVAEELPDQISEKYELELKNEGLNLRIDRFPFHTPHACLEWALPTIIGIYILKPYFDGFLKEISKDHYNILKTWLKKTAIDLRLIKVKTVVADESTQKIKEDNTQSKVFSVTSMSNTGEQLKFLFDDKLSDEDWQKGIELLLELLKEHFSNGVDDRLTIEIKNNELGREIFCILKTDTVDWEILDYKKNARKRINE